MDNDKDKTDSGRVTPVTPATPASPTRPAKTYVHPFAAAGHGQHRPNKNGGRSAKTSSGIHDVLDDSRSGRSAHSGHSRASSYSRRERTMAGHNFAATSPPSVKTKAPTFTTLATLVAEAETDKEDDFQPQSPLSIPDAESVNESRSSSIHVFNPPKPSEIFALLPPLPLPPPLPPVEPSFLALFTISPWKDGIFYLVPAVIFSIAAGFVLPYMALMVGNAFSALASYPRDVLTATDEQKRILMHDVGVTSVSFVAAGALGVLANYLMTVLWIRYSENTTSALRRMIFAGVEGKPMAWFDLSMGLQEEDANKIGAGGLMAKFTR
jgi:ATP-binding cassette subfamily B (MDR/TAP) protein 1